MRYEKGHKEASRQRILENASRRFRQEGIEAVGIASLMSDAGLTHGGFYSHFASKEELACAAMAQALDATTQKLREAGDEGGIDGLIRAYLTADHRDHPESGCALASSAAEIARRPDDTRTALSLQLTRIVALIAHLLEGGKQERHKKALAIFASMMGSLQLARMVADDKLSEEILHDGVWAAKQLAHG